MLPNTITDFPSHLKTQRLTEELASANKKLKEYEDLFAALYHTACQHCKARFQGAATTLSSASAANSSSSSIQAVVGQNALKRLPTSHEHDIPTSRRILKRPRLSLPESSNGEHGAAAPEPGSSSGASHHGVSTQLSIPSNKSIHAQYFVRTHDGTVGKPTLQVNLEHVWTHGSRICSVKFSPDGKYLAVGAHIEIFHPQQTYIYDVTTRRKICLLTDRRANKRHSGLGYLAFSPGDGRYLATGHSTGRTMIWQVGKKRVRNVFGVFEECVDFSPNGRFVVSGSMQGVRIWSIRDGSSKFLPDHDDAASVIWAVKFSPDGKHVVSSDFYGVVRLWNVRTSKLVKQWGAHNDTVWDVAFTPNGRGLVTAGHDHMLKYWDLDPPGGLIEVSLKFVGHTDRICALAISPDGRWVVSGSFDGTARIWNIVDASLQCTLLGHETSVFSVDFSPEGNYVACGDVDGNVSVWRCGS